MIPDELIGTIFTASIGVICFLAGCAFGYICAKSEQEEIVEEKEDDTKVG